MKTDPVRDWELERFLVGELPEKRLRDIETRIQTDPVLQNRLHMIQESDKGILHQYNAAEMSEKIGHRVEKEKSFQKREKKSPSVKRLFFALPAVSAALVLLVVALNVPHQKRILSFPDGTRIKGADSIDRSKPHLLIYKKTKNDADLLKDGDTVRDGDLLQIAYGSVNVRYGVILSIDGRGTVTLHYPENSANSARLGDQKLVLLSLSYELDDAPDFERFFFITSKSDLDVQRIYESARAIAREPGRARIENLQLPNAYNQYTVLLKKENTHE